MVKSATAVVEEGFQGNRVFELFDEDLRRGHEYGWWDGREEPGKHVQGAAFLLKCSASTGGTIRIARCTISAHLTFLTAQVWVWIEARQLASLAVADVDSWVRYDS